MRQEIGILGHGIMIIGLLVHLLFTTGCKPNSTPPDNQLIYNLNCSWNTVQGPTRIMAFGDSMTAGDAPASLVDGCAFSYAYQMSVDLTLTIVNQAVAGSQMDSDPDHTGMWPLILGTTFQSTDIVVWMPGFNDATHHGTDPVYMAHWKQELMDAIYIMAPQVHEVVILTTVPNPNYSIAALNFFAQGARDVVAEINLPNVKLVDTNQTFSPPNISNFGSDGVHLSVDSQKQVAMIVDGIL